MIDVIVGTQWGDEGKGKFVDWLTPGYEIVARYQGGPNAGHTIIYEGKKLVLHQIPAGITHDGILNVLGGGMVVDLDELEKEIEQLRALGIGVVGRLAISPSIHLILPFHRLIDSAENAGGKISQVGSTGRGIGPAYADKRDRRGLRLIDLAYSEQFKERFTAALESKKRRWQDIDFSGINGGETCTRYQTIFQRLRPMLADIPALLGESFRKQQRAIAEGSQATHLDITFGTYPYVTSSHPISGGVATGLGISPKYVRHIFGVTKAYTTRVGQGPFPTEIIGAVGDELRELGNEYGATTGRPRRCGWFDAVIVKRAALLNGLDQLLLTKLDVLGKFPEIKICYGYEGDLLVGDFPHTVEEMLAVRPRYTTMPGWQCDLSACRRRSDLPRAALNYIAKIEELGGIRVAAVSVGPGREETIEL